MSWLSVAWGNLVKHFTKTPTEISCHKLVTRYLQVVGEGGGAEILAGKGGVRITLSNPTKFKNHFSVILKNDGSINMDFVGPDGTVKGALDMSSDGVFVPRFSIPPSTPQPPPSLPDNGIPDV